jgi:hypothetical protein
MASKRRKISFPPVFHLFYAHSELVGLWNHTATSCCLPATNSIVAAKGVSNAVLTFQCPLVLIFGTPTPVCHHILPPPLTSPPPSNLLQAMPVVHQATCSSPGSLGGPPTYVSSHTRTGPSASATYVSSHTRLSNGSSTLYMVHWANYPCWCIISH